MNYINSHKLPNISFQFNRKNPVLTLSTIIIGGCTKDFSIYYDKLSGFSWTEISKHGGGWLRLKVHFFKCKII